MQSVSGIFNAQISQNRESQPRTSLAGEFSFIDAARSVAVNWMAVVERGKTEDLAMRRKQAAGFNPLGDREEEEDIFDLIAGMQKYLKKISGQ